MTSTTTLTGSAKQIEWASQIIAKCEAAMPSAIEMIAAENSAEAMEVAKDAAKIIEENPSAAWWIDHRNQVSTPDALATLINDTICSTPSLLARLS